MIGNRNRLMRDLVCALLLISFLLMEGCGGTPVPAGQPEPANAGETSAPQAPIETIQPGEPGAPTEPPPDLDWAESWQPYPQGVQPVGNATLVPGYEPMRKGVAVMNDALKKMLVEHGLQINTARTVVLPETMKPSQPASSGIRDVPPVVMESGKFWEIPCLFNPACIIDDFYTYDLLYPPEGISNDIYLGFASVQAKPGMIAEGLYAYYYSIESGISSDRYDQPGLLCANSFQIDFGPVMPLDYDRNGAFDAIAVVQNEYFRIVVVEQEDNMLMINFEPQVCDPWHLPRVEFLLTSAYPPRDVDALIQDTNGTQYSLKSLAPDYSKGQTIEGTNPSQSAVFGDGNIPLNFVDVKEPDINCVFDLDCDRNWNAESGSGMDSFTLEGTGGLGWIDGLVRIPGEPGTPAEGLYGYQYTLDLRGLIGDPEVHCIESFSIEFGPVTPLDYDRNGTLDFGYIYNLSEYDYELNAPVGSRYIYKGDSVREGKPVAVEQKGNNLTFFFDPLICVGTDSFSNPGDLSFNFGLVSAYSPRSVDWQVRDKLGILYSGQYKSVSAPAYPQEQSIQETVSIAPVVAMEDPNAFDQAKLQEMFRTEGVVLGMLVLETNAPNSVIPSGTYLERAKLDGDKGVVELIEVTSGQVYYTVDLLARAVEDSSLIIPSASIFIGSKTCLTCLWGWYICRDCFFWEADQMELEECEQILSTVTPTP